MKVIVYTRQDGGVTVILPCVSQDDPPDFSQDDALQRALKKDVPASATNVRLVEQGEISNDRTFRNAWKDTGSKIDVDMPKARDIWRDKMRLARAPKLIALDIQFQRADEAGNQAKKQEIASKKQILRDVTELPAIEAAQTPEELKAVWPKELD